MRTEEFDQRLDDAWKRARSSGAITQTATQLHDHAVGYIPAAWRVKPPALLIDLGSGAGVPGIHLARELPSSRVVLLDSSKQRCEMAEAAVAAVGLGARVSVIHDRLDEMARESAWRESADAIVARLFGSPSDLAECGLALLRPGGRLVVSVSGETGSWWSEAPLERLGAVHETSWSSGSGSYVSVRKLESTPHRQPRRTPARRRDPWPSG